MFLWVRLMLGDNFNTDYLEGTKGDAEILATIDELPHLEEYGEESLDCIYETILSRPTVSQPQRRRRARRILRCLLAQHLSDHSEQMSWLWPQNSLHR